jgi:hypothetical protein
MERIIILDMDTASLYAHQEIKSGNQNQKSWMTVKSRVEKKSYIDRSFLINMLLPLPESSSFGKNQTNASLPFAESEKSMRLTVGGISNTCVRL